MILSRRQAHFYMITALCCVLPLVAIAAIITRPSVPTVEDNDLFQISNFADIESTQTTLNFAPITVQSVEMSAQVVEQDGQRFLQLVPQQALASADILVYLNPPDSSNETISDDALLLGKMAGASPRQFQLPSSFSESSPELLFYSRATSQVIATASLSAQNE